MTETDLHHQIRLAKAEGHPLDWDFDSVQEAEVWLDGYETGARENM